MVAQPTAPLHQRCPHRPQVVEPLVGRCLPRQRPERLYWPATRTCAAAASAGARREEPPAASPRASRRCRPRRPASCRPPGGPNGRTCPELPPSNPCSPSAEEAPRSTRWPDGPSHTGQNFHQLSRRPPPCPDGTPRPGGFVAGLSHQRSGRLGIPVSPRDWEKISRTGSRDSAGGPPQSGFRYGPSVYRNQTVPSRSVRTRFAGCFGRVSVYRGRESDNTYLHASVLPLVSREVDKALMPESVAAGPSEAMCLAWLGTIRLDRARWPARPEHELHMRSSRAHLCTSGLASLAKSTPLPSSDAARLPAPAPIPKIDLWGLHGRRSRGRSRARVRIRRTAIRSAVRSATARSGLAFRISDRL